MSRAERDARRKLLMLQGALYRLEIIQARVALKDAAKPKAVGGQLFGLLKFVLAHKRMSLVATIVPWLFRRARGSRLLKPALFALVSAAAAWLFLRRRHHKASAQG
jgi:hypothetical protein